MNLVDRYAEELHRSQQELAGIIDKIRVRKLRLAGQQAVSRMYKKIFTYAVFFLAVAPLRSYYVQWVKPRLIRTPRSYGQFALSTGKESPYICSKFNPLNTDTLLIRILSIAPSVSLLTEFDCTESFVSSLRKNRRDNDSLWLMSLLHRKARETSSCFRTVFCLSFSVDVSFLKLVSTQSLYTAAPSPPP